MNEGREGLKVFQKSWAKNKYWVMSRSQQSYNAIRLLAKGNEWNDDKEKTYLDIINNLEQVETTEKTLRVTYEHIWGYFKKIASDEEKARFKELIATVDPEILNFLKQLAKKYNQKYLLEMRWDFY